MEIDYCIVSAGLGTRFRPFSRFANKGLAPVPYKPIISRLIDKIPEESTIYICTGYKGDDLQRVLELHYPARKFVFIENPDYDSTGMGDSLLPVLSICENGLILMPNDGVYEQESLDISDYQSDFCLGVSTEGASIGDYLRLSTDNNGDIKSFERAGFAFDKSTTHNLVFTGLMFVKDTKYFHDLLCQCPSPREIYSPLGSLINLGLKVSAAPVKWRDCGTYDLYKKYISSIVDYDFSKSAEALLLKAGSPVIKIFDDACIAQKRVDKAGKYTNAFPRCSLLPSQSGYSYEYVTGLTLYDSPTKQNLLRLLDFLNENLWDTSCGVDIADDARLFYEKKTKSRISSLREKYKTDDIKSINDVPILAPDIIPRFDFDQFVFSAVSSPIHGDLQYDNCLVSDDGSISLLDWRHEFGKNVYYGDIYYDFAKLLGGVMLNYKRIKKNDFTCSINTTGSNITYYYSLDPYAKEHLTVIEHMIVSHGLSCSNAYKLLSLVFLNMSPLHEHPFDLMLLAMSHNLYYNGKF